MAVIAAVFDCTARLVSTRKLLFVDRFAMPQGREAAQRDVCKRQAPAPQRFVYAPKQCNNNIY